MPPKKKSKNEGEATPTKAKSTPKKETRHKVNMRDVLKKVPTKLFINNEFVDAVSGLTYPTINPATEEEICKVAEAGAEDVDLAVKAARDAFYEGEWGKTKAYERSKLLWALGDEVQKNADFFATLESLDNGKPRKDAAGADVPLVVQCFHYYAGWADKLTGKTFELGGPFTDQYTNAYTLHEPVGVVGQIIPWNFPLLMAAWKLAPALAVGCSVVLKVAEQTPLTALYLASLIKAVGFPKGAVNIITGFGHQTTDGKLGPGAALVAHPEVSKIAFTGSTAVGRIIMKEAATSFKRITLELGGKSPNIIFPDADLDAAIKGSHEALFFNQGQCCCAGSRLFVHEDIYDEFVRKSVELAKERIVGDPLDDGVSQGPQVSDEQFKTVMAYIESGKSEGATCLVGGNRSGSKGYFIEPTVFVDVKPEMKIYEEEIFGPVMCIIKFSTIDEVIAAANKTIYGLAAAVWTRDPGTAQRIIREVRAGTIWVNCYDVFDASAAFGGFKSSGMGRELGEYALKNYTEVKQVTMRLVPTNK
jgi:aldehyde dehydrogenase (NAD+)